MNISIAIEKFDATVGGAERYCWDLANFLTRKGHTVAVICLKASENADRSIQIIKVPALRFPQAMRHLSFAILHFLKAREMRDYIHFCVGNTFFMDIYQPHGGVHRAWFLRETAMYKEPFRSCVRLFRRLSLKDAVQRAMEFWIFSITKPQVIAISKMVSDDIETFFHYPKSKIHLAPNGIDTSRYSPENRIQRKDIRRRYGLNADEFVFLFVAQNPRLKGYDILIDACLELEQLNFKVLIVGPFDSEMKQKADPLGDRIIFAGRVDDLHKVYPATDCLVHPTYYDACSLVVLESLASGVPVITTNANGASMFLDKENGIIVEPGNPSALAEAMKGMIEKVSRSDIGGKRFTDQEGVFAEVEEILEKYGVQAAHTHTG